MAEAENVNIKDDHPVIDPLDRSGTVRSTKWNGLGRSVIAQYISINQSIKTATVGSGIAPQLNNIISWKPATRTNLDGDAGLDKIVSPSSCPTLVPILSTEQTCNSPQQT